MARGTAEASGDFRMKITTHEGQIVDLNARCIFPGIVTVEDGRVSEIIRSDAVVEQTFLLPGFVDAHVHIESSMLSPAEFGRIAVRHGTVATVSDPHEIANVLGVAGVDFMIESARCSPIKTLFGAPSCVPATAFETAGAQLNSDAVAELLGRLEIGYLSEVMNYPGVLHEDPEVMRKIAFAKTAGKPIDGHAPGLRGLEAKQYAAAGITTDHECFTLVEALDKLDAGMRISIREGSAARNFEALESLLQSHPERCMLCTDDMHPNALVHGHINLLVCRAIAGGANVFDVLRCASTHPVEHYRMKVGLLRTGDPADFIRVKDLTNFAIIETWIDGVLAAKNGVSLTEFQPGATPNSFAAQEVTAADFAITADGNNVTVRVIEAKDGQLITGASTQELPCDSACVRSSPDLDVLKIAVVNRYHPAPVSVAFIRGFGLKRGAIASSVAHDSHNIVAVGVDDESLAGAVNAVIRTCGGVCAWGNSGEMAILPLEIAGLMSSRDGDSVATRYQEVAALARSLGSPLRDPFMTLSFMALLVIPDLKLSDQGLFSGSKFEFSARFV